MINNISDNSFYSEVDSITQEYSDIGITSMQFYSILFALTIIIIAFLGFIYMLVKTYINKSCAGCKRLAKAEKRLAELEKQISLNGYFDNQTFNNLSAKIDKIQEELKNG